jgi:hypothetical protein
VRDNRSYILKNEELQNEIAETQQQSTRKYELLRRKFEASAEQTETRMLTLLEELKCMKQDFVALKTRKLRLLELFREIDH